MNITIYIIHTTCFFIMFNGKVLKFSSSAKNKRTNRLELANFANKFDCYNVKNEYICCDCNQGLKLAKGGVRKHYFSHICLEKCKTHTITELTESFIHKEAKIQLKIILESPIVVSIKRICPYKSTCITTTVIPQLDSNDEIVLEHSFKFDSIPLLKSIAELDKDSTSIIFDDIRCVNCYECHKQYLHGLYSKELKQKINDLIRQKQIDRDTSLKEENELIRKKQIEENKLMRIKQAEESINKKQTLITFNKPRLFLPPHSREITLNPKPKPVYEINHIETEILKSHLLQQRVVLNDELAVLNRRYDMYDRDKTHKIIFEEQDFNRMLYLRFNSVNL